MDYENTESNDTNLTTTDYFDESYEEFLAKRDLTVRIYTELYTILSLICIAVNIIMAFVIMKYRRLRSETSNIILLNWLIVNNFFLMSSPVIARLASSNPDIYYDFRLVFCILEQTQYSVLLANLMLISLLLINWYLKVYHNAKHQKFTKILKFVLAAVYVTIAFCIGFHVHSCFLRNYSLSEAFLVISYLVFIVFMIIMNIVHAVKKRRLVNTANVSNMPLHLANIYFLSVCPLLTIILSQFLWYHFFIFEILFIGGLILTVMNPIYFFVTLFVFDKDYRTFLNHTLTCKCSKYKDDEMLEEPVFFNGNVEI